MKPLGDTLDVYAKLVRVGYGSIKDWADKHGYKPVTVYRVIHVWGNRTDKEPHGGLAREIMRRLRETLAQ